MDENINFVSTENIIKYKNRFHWIYYTFKLIKPLLYSSLCSNCKIRVKLFKT